MSLDPYKARAELCRRSFYKFVQAMWSTVVTEPPVWNWHIKYLCDELQRVGERVKRREVKEFDYFIINIPPGSSKSTIVSIFYPLWCWTIDPTQRFICGSYASLPAEDIADKCKRAFTSERYRKLFPEVGVRKEAMTHLQTAHNGERYTTSVGGSITGIHAHQIIIDDPLNTQLSASEAERLSANNWITKTVSSRKVDGDITVTIIIMQRLHEDDPTGHILEMAKPDKKTGESPVKVKHVCLPAEESDRVVPAELRQFYVNGLMDVKRGNVNHLKLQKVVLGPYGFAGQYEQNPAPSEGGIMKRRWFPIVDMEHHMFWKKFTLDTAYTEDAQNDPSGFLSYFMHENKMYITNWESHLLEFPELCAYTKSYVSNNGYSSEGSYIKVEPKASGKSLVQTLQKETRLAIMEAPNPERDKTARLTDCTPHAAAGRICLIRGAWNEAFLKEVCNFPNAKHDEAVDNLTIAVFDEFVGETVQEWEDALNLY